MLKRLSSLPIEQQDALYLEVLSKLDEKTERGSQLRTLLAMLYLYSSKGVNEVHLKRICSAFKTPVEVMDFLMKRGAEIKCIRGRYRLNAFDDGEKFQMTFKTTYLVNQNVQ